MFAEKFLIRLLERGHWHWLVDVTNEESYVVFYDEANDELVWADLDLVEGMGMPMGGMIEVTRW